MVAHHPKENMNGEQIGVTVPSATVPGLSDGRAARGKMAIGVPFATAWLKSELDLYLANRWCLNPFPTISELLGRLHRELRQVTAADEVWHRAEAITNVLLMSCAIADTIDDDLLGVCLQRRQGNGDRAVRLAGRARVRRPDHPEAQGSHVAPTHLGTMAAGLGHRDRGVRGSDHRDSATAPRHDQRRSRSAAKPGRRETRYVLAKSVGWGWFAYHAFIPAVELAPFIAPVLGLRDGILYMEWLPQSCGDIGSIDREQIVRMVGLYVSARARFLKLHGDPCPDLSRRRYHDGIELLGSVLARACGSRVAAALHGPRIRHELSRFSSPVATLIDGRMHPREWITADGALLKTDFEHHGLGKSTLNMTDPAYDLAEAILSFGLSRDEEATLLAHYVEDSGDGEVEERLLLNKILAGSAAMGAALTLLGDRRLAPRHADANRSYLEAWHFLTTQTARFCGSALPRAEPIRWRSPLMVLDVDGVVDTRRFGFPCTTAAGMHALSLLHTHNVAIAMNTARAIGEVKEYCDAYGCAGAVAEYGSVVWDAMGRRERVLASPNSLRQLERVRGALREIQGVYLDDIYRYSIRAYSFEGDSMVPLSAAMVGDLVSRLGADEVAVRQTTIDTAIHAQDVDKGKGLRALLDLAGLPDPDTTAVGDSEPDLAMFRAAQRCFAPANILCRPAAVEIGCHIVDAPYQRGLLEVVRRVLHPDGRRCALCDSAARATRSHGNLFLKLLGFADRARGGLLLRAVADPMAIRAFVAGE
jgi:hydroxymethylpyrimidine pyrophosphatase-like HAD family hydrolase